MSAFRVANGLTTFALGVPAGVFCAGLYWHNGNMLAGSVGAFFILGLIKLTMLGAEED